MAKPKSTPTAIQKAAEAARERYQAANEAFKKNENDKTKKARDDAQTALKTAADAERKERFEKVGTNRTKIARAAIRNVGKCFDPKGYAFDKAQADKILAGIDAAVADVRKAINVGLSGSGSSGKAADDFAL